MKPLMDAALPEGVVGFEKMWLADVDSAFGSDRVQSDGCSGSRG